MRYSKSSLLSFTLAVAFSSSAMSGSVGAQSPVTDFPWRAKAKPQAVAQKIQAFAQTVKSAAKVPQQVQAQTAAVVSSVPSQHQLPEFFYDQGKKYIRQGDVYVESTDVGKFASAVSSATNAVTHGNFGSPIPQDAQKQSMFDKAKSLSARLNPLNKIFASNPSAYKSKTWDVPSFSKSLSFLDKAPADPITFAAVTPLPAKTAMPSAIDDGAPLYASSSPYSSKSAATAIANRFTSALPTETAITPAVASTPPRSNSDFSLGQDFSPAAGRQVSVFDTAPATTKTNRTASLSADNQFWSPQR